MVQRNSPSTLLEEQPAQPEVVREVAMTPVTAAPVALADDTVLLFERLAKDPQVDVAKLKELIALQEHIIAKNAESMFWADFAVMQGELPTIEEDGRIAVDGVVRSRYSTNENVQEAIRPILQKHGFALSFRNTTAADGRFKVTGILAHRGGHQEKDEFESKPDDGGKMNSIQRIGSTRSYGQRYTTIALLNIVSRAPADRDDDGKNAGRPDPPDGIEAWWAVMEGIATSGTKALDEAWGKARPEFKTYTVTHNRDAWNALKATAAVNSRLKTR